MKLLEIEEEEARERQRLAGDRNLKQNVKVQEIRLDSKEPPVPQNSGGPERLGEAMKLAARQVRISHDTLRRAKKIDVAAETDPKIKESWDKAQQGKGSVNAVYQEVQEKEKAQKAAQGKRRGYRCSSAPPEFWGS